MSSGIEHLTREAVSRMLTSERLYKRRIRSIEDLLSDRACAKMTQSLYCFSPVNSWLYNILTLVVQAERAQENVN